MIVLVKMKILSQRNDYTGLEIYHIPGAVRLRTSYQEKIYIAPGSALRVDLVESPSSFSPLFPRASPANSHRWTDADSHKSNPYRSRPTAAAKYQTLTSEMYERMK